MRRLPASVLQPLLGVVGIILLLALWQWGSTQVSTERALPSVVAVGDALLTNLTSPAVWLAIGQTLGIALLGWALAAVIGVVLGVLAGTSRVFSAATRGLLDFLRPIPAIVILPLVLLLLGPTTEMALFLVIFGVVLPIAAQTAAGVEAADPVARSTARSFGLGSIEILWRVVLPGASPYIGTAMRVAAPVTLVMVVVGGMLGGAPGLGSMLSLAQMTGRYVDLFSYVVILGVLGLIVQAASTRVERTVLHWHSSYRQEGI